MTPEQAAGLARARALVMATLPVGPGQAADTPIEDRPGYFATDIAYFDDVIARWKVANPGEDEAACRERALNSYAGITDAQVPVDAPPLSPEGKKAALIAYAANKRWQVETGGVTVNGITVPTNADGQRKILGAAGYLADGATSPLIIDGVVYGEMSKAQFGVVNAAIVEHIRKSYVTLATVLAGINDGSITTTDQINAANW